MLHLCSRITCRLIPQRKTERCSFELILLSRSFPCLPDVSKLTDASIKKAHVVHSVPKFYLNIRTNACTKWIAVKQLQSCFKRGKREERRPKPERMTEKLCIRQKCTKQTNEKNWKPQGSTNSCCNVLLYWRKAKCWGRTPPHLVENKWLNADIKQVQRTTAKDLQWIPGPPTPTAQSYFTTNTSGLSSLRRFTSSERGKPSE